MRLRSTVRTQLRLTLQKKTRLLAGFSNSLAIFVKNTSQESTHREVSDANYNNGNNDSSAHLCRIEQFSEIVKKPSPATITCGVALLTLCLAELGSRSPWN